MSIFGRPRRDEELDRELAFHIEQETEKLLSTGLDPAEARRRALVGCGGVERFREATLDEQRERGLDVLARDIRHGARGVIRSPLHTAASVLSLALGIGAAVAMFTVADGVLLRPLPYGSADRLVTAFEAREAGGIRTPSYPSFRDWHGELNTFEAITFVRGEEFRLRSEEGTQRLLAGYVSGDFFRTTQTAPLLGRVFDESDGVHTVVLPHALWQRGFGGDPSVIGRNITTADASFTVTGVMPPGFRLPSWADVWAPLSALPADAAYALTQRNVHVDAEVWGLVREGVTIEQARRDLARVVSRLSAQYGDEDGWTTASLAAVRDQVVGDGAVQQLRILIAAVALMLLIVCVNVAGLQLARGSTRGMGRDTAASHTAGRCERDGSADGCCGRDHVHHCCSRCGLRANPARAAHSGHTGAEDRLMRAHLSSDQTAARRARRQQRCRCRAAAWSRSRRSSRTAAGRSAGLASARRPGAGCTPRGWS